MAFDMTENIPFFAVEASQTVLNLVSGIVLHVKVYNPVLRRIEK